MKKPSKTKKTINSIFRIERWSQPHQPNAAMMRYLLTSEGYNVFQWSDRPATIYGMRKHAHEQSHWVFSGALEITAQSIGTYVLQAGDRDFLPAEIYHTLRVVGEEPAIYLIGEKKRE